MHLCILHVHGIPCKHTRALPPNLQIYTVCIHSRSAAPGAIPLRVVAERGMDALRRELGERGSVLRREQGAEREAQVGVK